MGINDTIGSLSLTVTTFEDSSRNIVTSKFFDGLGRTTSTVQNEDSGAGITTTTSYDGLARVSQTSNPFRQGDSLLYTTTAYDGLSRVTSVTSPDSSAVNTYYSGNRVLVKDQAGKERLSQVDGIGRLTDVWEITTAADSATDSVTFPQHSEAAFGYHTSYGYDVLGDLTLVSQGNQSRTFKYDGLKRLSQAVNPESQTISYAYDNDGNLTTKSDSRGVAISYVYDHLNRITSRTYTGSPTPPVSYFYDGLGVSGGVANSIGRLTAMSSSVSEGDYTAYDATGRVTGYTQKTGGQSYAMAYSYNLAGAMTSETYPSGRIVNTQYDTAGRINQVSSGATKYERDIAYAAFGGVTSATLGNSLVEQTTFDSNRLQPTEIQLGQSGTPGSVFDLQYTYNSGSTTHDDNGDILEEKLTVGTNVWDQKYTYDSLNRIASAA
ncbi:MAG TPA: hypothetical protein VJX67_10035, partial [Blastocatellia bacterium]|nr:hypothetical protein [Blastocatellia bacterium]